MNEGGAIDVWIRNLSLELFYNTNFMGTERHPLPSPGTGHQQYIQVQEPFQVILTSQKSKAGYQVREALPLLSSGAMPSSLA